MLPHHAPKTIITIAVLTCLAIVCVKLRVFHHKKKPPPNPFLCYFEPGNEIPYLSDWIKPPADSIYFVETSCRGALDSRQACAVESAARSQGNTTTIHVLFLAPVRNNGTSFKTLQQFRQVKIARVDIFDLSIYTPLEFLADSDALKRSIHWVHHLSDFARYLLMYKWGGVYLDLDTVVVKDLRPLGGNWAARQSEDTVGAGAMAFSRDAAGRMFADAAIRDLAKNFRGDRWDDSSVGVITRVLENKCLDQDPYDMEAYILICKGFEVYDQKLFYPISFNDAYMYFKPGKISDSPYAFHMWNYITHNTRLRNSSMYAALARRHCPSVYEAYGHRFGS